MGELWNFYKKLFPRKNKDKQTYSDHFLYAKGEPLYAKYLYAKGGHIDHGKTTLTMLRPRLVKKQRQGKIVPVVPPKWEDL